MTVIRLASILWLAAAIAHAQAIRLKTRTISPSNATPPPIQENGGVRHYLVLFGSYPGPDVVSGLALRRIVVDAYVPENALLVSAGHLDLRGLDVLWAAPVDPSDKISPTIANGGAAAYLVILAPDVDTASVIPRIESLGFAIATNAGLLPGQLVVSGAFSGLPALAAMDEVTYILPASTELQNGDAIVGCAGALTPLGPVPQFALADNGWSRDANGHVALQYFFDSLTADVPESQVRSAIERAFATWAQYANISISPAAGPQLNRSIDILFARYGHGDAYPFDGPNGVLAHTFYPAPGNPEPIAGDMHLNADEPWSTGGTFDIFSVALHETGHALGLAHSDNPAAVMYPYYRLQTGLSADDIAAIQALYGANGTSAVSSPPATGSGPNGGTTTNAPSGSGNSSSSASDTTPPSLTILTPNATIVSTSASTIAFSGTAGDNVGVASVEWATSTGGSGTASGTTAWWATIPLLVGNNTVTIRASDAAGNSSWRAVTVVRE